MKEKWDKIDQYLAGILGVGVGALASIFVYIRPLTDWDEGLYANVVGEIVKGGHWLHLFLQGAPWFDKEPLGFWLMAISTKLFGLEVWALRLPGLLATALAAAIFYWLLRTRVNRTIAVATSLIFWTAPILWLRHTLGTADLEAFTILFSIGIPAAYLYWPKKIWPVLTVFGLFLLTRGVWALPFLGFLIALEIINFLQTKNRQWLINFSVGILLAFIPWLAWHALQYQFKPDDYVRIYWQEQFFTRVRGAVDGHTGGLNFYWNFTVEQLAIWYALLLVVSSSLVFCKKEKWLSLWLLVTLIPPHLISTKLSWYLVPALPALFMAFGVSAQIIFTKKKLTAFGLALLAVGLLLFNTHKLIKMFWYFAYSDRQEEIIINQNQTIIPADAPVITYGVKNWTLGRVLPAFYWHTHLVQNWNIISVDQKSAEYYLADPNKYEYWWVTTSTLPNLQKYESFSGCSLVQSNDYILLTTATSSPLCRENL